MSKKFLNTSLVLGLFVVGMATSLPSVAMDPDKDNNTSLRKAIQECTGCGGKGFVTRQSPTMYAPTIFEQCPSCANARNALTIITQQTLIDLQTKFFLDQVAALKK